VYTTTARRDAEGDREDVEALQTVHVYSSRRLDTSVDEKWELLSVLQRL
jgi:hypothetical protein